MSMNVYIAFRVADLGKFYPDRKTGESDLRGKNLIRTRPSRKKNPEKISGPDSPLQRKPDPEYLFSIILFSGSGIYFKGIETISQVWIQPIYEMMGSIF